MTAAEGLSVALDLILGLLAVLFVVGWSAVLICAFGLAVACIIVFALDFAFFVVDALRLSGHHPARRAIAATQATAVAAAVALHAFWFAAVFLFRKMPPCRTLRARARARRLAFCRYARPLRHFNDYVMGRREDPPADWPGSSSGSAGRAKQGRPTTE